MIGELLSRGCFFTLVLLNVVTVKVYGYKRSMVCRGRQDLFLAQLMPLENQTSFQMPQPFRSFTKGLQHQEGLTPKQNLLHILYT